MTPMQGEPLPVMPAQAGIQNAGVERWPLSPGVSGPSRSMMKTAIQALLYREEYFFTNHDDKG